MTNIRKSLEDLAVVIENLQTTPTPEPKILDRGLSGNKIHGGKITKFSSSGIEDLAKEKVLVVKDDGLHVDVVHISKIQGTTSVEGDLKVSGAVHAQRMHVEEVTADVRHERTDPLAFHGKTAFGKGLIWPASDYTKQFILQERPDRFFATESIELRAGKIFMINGQNVLSQDTLGNLVTKSNLQSLGVLDKLEIAGSLSVDNFLYYDPNSERLSLGTEAANGMLSLSSIENEFVIDPKDNGEFKIGTYTTSGFDIVTDDTPRISIDLAGKITFLGKAIFKDKVGVGVKNFATDADITTAGPVRFQDKKFEVDSNIPDNGSYKKGDVVWNSNPKPTGYVGWICVREGTPGEWKPFGQIAK